MAFLYSAVGHAGASGYIAVMTLLGFATPEIRPTALLLNIFVAVLGTIHFARAGHFRWSLFWPFAVLSVPPAFIGGSLRLPTAALKILLAVVLLFSAFHLIFRKGDPPVVHAPPTPAALGVGAGVGFLSGITGTGGGIFLTPLLLFCKWATTRSAAAGTVVFILINSIAGLAGYLWSQQAFPSFAWTLALAAVLGGGVGSYVLMATRWRRMFRRAWSEGRVWTRGVLWRVAFLVVARVADKLSGEWTVWYPASINAWLFPGRRGERRARRIACSR